MKFSSALLSVFFPIITISAASFEQSEFIEDDENYHNLPVFVDLWEVVPNELPSISIPTIDSSQSQMSSWSFMSFLGSFLSSLTPSKPPSAQELDSLSISDVNVGSGSVTDADLDLMASIFNCNKNRLRDIDASIVQRVNAMRDMRKTEIFYRLVELNDITLFEIFTDCNLLHVLAETLNNREFQSLVLGCIKIKSLTTFVNIMNSLKYKLIAPQAVVVASMYGSKDILRTIMSQKNCEEYVWSWENVSGDDGFMLEFGKDPFTAALFLGALKAISGDHLDCLKLLVYNGLDVTYNNFLLLKVTASSRNIDHFTTLLSAASTTVFSEGLMNEILVIATNNNNDALVEYLFRTDYRFHIGVQSHLITAIKLKNKNMFDLFFARLPPTCVNQQILTQAAMYGTPEIFIELLKVSDELSIMSAVCSCISKPEFRNLVPEIVHNIKLSHDVITQGLLYSVKTRSSHLVQLFLNIPECVLTNVTHSFIEALMTNDEDIVNGYLKRFNAHNLIHVNKISSTVEKLFENQAWKSLKIFVENYYQSSNFPKTNFVSKIMETDQVEIAKLVSEMGATFPQSRVIYVRNERMREFILPLIKEDLTKSQLKKRK